MEILGQGLNKKHTYLVHKFHQTSSIHLGLVSLDAKSRTVIHIQLIAEEMQQV